MKSVLRLLVSTVIALVSFSSQATPSTYPTPGIESTATASFFAGMAGDVVGYFTGISGGYDVLAGARINGVDGTPGLDNHSSAYGDRFVFGSVLPGDSVVFFIDVIDTHNRFYSDKSLNFDGVNHFWYDVYGGDSVIPGGFNLAFEDLLNGGDFNYGDHGFVIGVEPSTVPEPGTLALLGLAMAGIALGRRRLA